MRAMAAIFQQAKENPAFSAAWSNGGNGRSALS
jgi:hypothetical protein